MDWSKDFWGSRDVFGVDRKTEEFIWPHVSPSFIANAEFVVTYK